MKKIVCTLNPKVELDGQRGAGDNLCWRQKRRILYDQETEQNKRGKDSMTERYRY